MVTDSVGHVAALPAQLIAEPRELLLPGQVLPAGADPLIAPDDSVRGHGRCSFPRVARPARRGARAGFPFGRSKPTAGTVSALRARRISSGVDKCPCGLCRRNQRTAKISAVTISAQRASLNAIATTKNGQAPAHGPAQPYVVRQWIMASFLLGDH